MRSLTRWGLGLAGVVAVLAPAEAATVTPITDFTFLAGQNFYDGASTSLGGNADVIFTPVITFSDRWSLFPTYHGFYQGTQEVSTLGSGGVPFRDSTGHSLLMKGVWTLGAWKIKPSVGGTMEWLRETRDEEWGQGLYDYRKVNGGLETQYDVSSQAGGRLAYDYFQMNFPNYESLESDQDATLSRELAGKDVLNNSNHMGTLTLWTPLPGRGRLDFACLEDARTYADQPVIDSEGQPTSTERKDEILTADAVVSYPFPSPFGGTGSGDLGLRYETQNSNQAHYDAKKVFYQANYYDYHAWRVSPNITLPLVKNRWTLVVEGVYERREYDQRTTQDSLGDYLSEKMYVSNLSARVGIAHRLSEHTKLRVESSMGWNHSNNTYEEIFQYNYRTANYGVGFSYDY